VIKTKFETALRKEGNEALRTNIFEKQSNWIFRPWTLLIIIVIGGSMCWAQYDVQHHLYGQSGMRLSTAINLRHDVQRQYKVLVFSMNGFRKGNENILNLQLFQNIDRDKLLSRADAMAQFFFSRNETHNKTINFTIYEHRMRRWDIVPILSFKNGAVIYPRDMKNAPSGGKK